MGHCRDMVVCMPIYSVCARMKEKEAGEKHHSQSYCLQQYNCSVSLSMPSQHVLAIAQHTTNSHYSPCLLPLFCCCGLPCLALFFHAFCNAFPLPSAATQAPALTLPCPTTTTANRLPALYAVLSWNWPSSLHSIHALSCHCQSLAALSSILTVTCLLPVLCTCNPIPLPANTCLPPCPSHYLVLIPYVPCTLVFCSPRFFSPALLVVCWLCIVCLCWHGMLPCLPGYLPVCLPVWLLLFLPSPCYI